ncbi:uncharacterized protein N7459_007194 [Penicillium hispanicum]|uniref:uncharacterized protein n=1 Tax=Penicillium hispanicum TaxID=1080232 RepID=UPI00254203A5|nr:uncharacterized protein N7459_007194 [Penicillium hispanicum]KAJ5578230.1 hypothetical protein N7459_007194 [Penicillium hispanicum]
MQMINLLGFGLAVLASTAAAMPRFAGAYHGARIHVHVPTNSTGAYHATSTGTGTRGKAILTTGVPRPQNGTHGHVQHGVKAAAKDKHVNVNHCHELCSLESQTCSLAVPDDDKFCWQTYLRCVEKCRPEDF